MEPSMTRTSSVIFHDLVAWCQDHAPGGWHLEVGYTKTEFRFKDDRDRMLFDVVRPLIEKGLVDLN